MWDIILSDLARRQLRKLGNTAQRDILNYLEKRVAPADDPRRFGKALSSDLKGLWRYRVGDYRILCHIEEERLVVLIVEVGHRKNIYD